jgi:hypothetical protein
MNGRQLTKVLFCEVSVHAWDVFFEIANWGFSMLVMRDIDVDSLSIGAQSLQTLDNCQNNYS